MARLAVDALDHIDVHDGNAVAGAEQSLGPQADLLGGGKTMIDVLGWRVPRLHPRRPERRGRAEVMGGDSLIEMRHSFGRVATRPRERGLRLCPGVVRGTVVGWWRSTRIRIRRGGGFRSRRGGWR